MRRRTRLILRALVPEGASWPTRLSAVGGLADGHNLGRAGARANRREPTLTLAPCGTMLGAPAAARPADRPLRRPFALPARGPI